MKSTTFTTPSNCRYLKFYLYGEETYNNNAIISLYHSGWKAEDAKYQPYEQDIRKIDQRIKDEFPNGMQKWDMVYNKNGKGYIVKGTGKVDMGTLNYVYQPPIEGSFQQGYFTTRLQGKANGNINMLCGKYNTVADWMTVGVRGDNSSDDIYIKDSAYTSAASFKSAMAGVPLYYELAAPTIIEYDEPFNLDYLVWDFGTEEIIADKPSAPIKADIIYQFNAVDMIREHEAEITELQKVIATMQAQLTSLINQ